jgi:hypothetical protein
VFKAVVERSRINPADIGDIVVGSVLGPSSQRANEARIASFFAGIPEEVPVRTVNRCVVCAVCAVVWCAALCRCCACQRARCNDLRCLTHCRCCLRNHDNIAGSARLACRLWQTWRRPSRPATTQSASQQVCCVSARRCVSASQLHAARWRPCLSVPPAHHCPPQLTHSVATATRRRDDVVQPHGLGGRHQRARGRVPQGPGVPHPHGRDQRERGSSLWRQQVRAGV